MESFHSTKGSIVQKGLLKCSSKIRKLIILRTVYWKVILGPQNSPYTLKRQSSSYYRERKKMVLPLVLYWHQWFHEEPLISTEPFHSKLVQKGYFLLMVLFNEMFFEELIKMSSMASLQKNTSLWNLYCDECSSLFCWIVSISREKFVVW